VTVREFARISGLGESCVRSLVKKAGFPVFKNGKKYMIHQRAADQWLEKQARGCGAFPGAL